MRVLLLLCCLMLSLPAAAQTRPTSAYSLGFAGYGGGPALKWLEKQGFVAKQDASSPSKVAYAIALATLRLEAKQKALALLLNETNVIGFARIRIEWGVDAFPPGASYEKGVRSDAVMIYVFFGDEKLSSGSMLVPDSPYFIGLFLCQDDPVDKPFTGRYFKAGGRYVCVDRATAGKSLVSEYAIADAFRRFFGTDATPNVSGIGIAIDTDSAKGNGTAKSFVKKIEFLD